MQGTGYIGIVIKLRQSDGWANTGPCRQMRDGIELFAGKKIAHGILFPQIDLKHRRMIFDRSYVCALGLRIIKIVEVIKNRDAVPECEELFDKMRPDEPGAP